MLLPPVSMAGLVKVFLLILVVLARIKGDTTNDEQSTILITGVAGFIGFHMARKLSNTKPGYQLVGLDNFDPYYDVNLKRHRAELLQQHNDVILHEGDVCDEQLLLHLFDKYHVTMVIHFAAQAGVRYSINDPLAYVRSNIECFAVLLEQLRHYKKASLLYASSSSVYGKDSPLPFSAHHSTGYPGNLYAASKLSNEMFADTYCNEYNMWSVGVRFFTVYGPWGRPDMAVYKFAEKISSGEAIPLFQSSSHEPLMRDFTYIDDVIDGLMSVVQLLTKRHGNCGDIYNLGYGAPVAVETMISYLEEELNKKASLQILPLPPSEMLMTFADISESKRILQFQPKINLRAGIKLFVKWFKSYHGNKIDNMGAQAKRQLDSKLLNEEVDIKNKVFHERLGLLQNKYLLYAAQNKIEQPDVKKKGYIFYPGMESPGRMIMKAPSYKGHIEAMKRRCSLTEQCVGFNTQAEFKSLILPESSWKTVEGEGAGLYIADIDMCLADLHDCSEHAECVYKGPSQFECVCLDGYYGNGKHCVRIYSEEVALALEQEAELADYIDGTDHINMKRNSNFIFFQGYDSPGGDHFIIIHSAGNVTAIRNICMRSRRCIGFNTNGLVKLSIRPPHHWYQWTKQPHHGLYVLDYDYCSLSEEVCPKHSRCRRHAPGNYSCSCDPGYKMTTKQNECITSSSDHVTTAGDHVTTASDHVIIAGDHVTTSDVTSTVINVSNDNPGVIHIILSVDEEHLQGLVTTMNSILKHSSRPSLLYFHIVIAGQPIKLLQSYLQCHSLLLPGQVEVKQFNSDWLDGQIAVHSSKQLVGNLASQANFARFFFHRLFPQLNGALYLDVDVIVKEDVMSLWQQVVTSNKLIVVVQRASPSYGNMFNDKVKKLFRERYGYVFKDSDPSFNAGVFAINLDLWRKGQLLDEALYWMKQNADHPLWQFGTQPVMLMLSHNNWDLLDPKWNIDGLGWNEKISSNRLDSAYLLHWSGRRKPWLHDGLYLSYWLPYQPEACSSHGSCDLLHNVYYCNCHHEYSGLTCNERQ